MTVPPLLELVRRTSERITTDYDLDAGLDPVVRAIQEAEDPGEAVLLAKGLLRERVRAARAVVLEVEGLRTQVKHLAKIVRFSEEGWPARRAELERRLAEDPLDGLADWLEDWFAAISQGRTAAARRMLEITGMPPGADRLLDRCMTTAVALEERNWQVAEPLLEAGAAQIPVGDRKVPKQSDTRYLLRLLLARLALGHDQLAHAERFLDEAGDGGDTPALNALWAWLFRLRGEEGRALKHLADASRSGPTDLDVALESIEWATGEDRLGVGLDAARVAVDAVVVLPTIDEELARLARELPAELWIAVAERALRENERELFERALERAWFAAPYSEVALQAAIAELRVSGAEQHGAASEDRFTSLMAAGDAFLDASQLDRAAGYYSRAHELMPDRIDASLKLADCLIAMHAFDPLDTSREVIEDSLALIVNAQREDAITPANAWSYLAEASARERLAEASGPDQFDHLWHAFVAVCRAVAYAPYSAARWVDLSGAADALNLPLVTVAAATHAVDLDPTDERSHGQHILALANVGRFTDALDTLGERSEPWDIAARGYLQARLGECHAAVNLLRATDLDPTWSWARLTFIWSLATTDRGDEAVAEAKSLARTWEARLDEEAAVSPTMWAYITLGHFTRVLRLADELFEDATDPSDDSLPLGVARLLSGAHEAGIEGTAGALRRVTTTRELDEWSVLLEPYLRVVAARYGVELPPLDGIRDAVGRRRDELAARQDPLADLREAPTDELDGDIAAVAIGLGSALIRLAGDDPAGALEELEEASLAGPEVDLLRASLHEELAPGAGASAAAQAPDMVPEEVEAESGTVPQQIEVSMPASWFDGHPDPINDHELFLRYLPEMRMRATGFVPYIQVHADESLDPDRYQVFAQGELAYEGRADPSQLYLSDAALSLLRPDVAQETAPDTATGMVRLPADVASQHGFLMLLGWPAAEVAARQVGEVAARQSERLTSA